MKKQKKILIIFIFSIITLFSTDVVLAENSESKHQLKNGEITIQKVEYSEDFKRWLTLSDEEKENALMPRMYDIPFESKITKNSNLFLLTRMLGASVDSKYSLKDVIPDNVVIKNQMQTYSCWTFASLSSLETNLAMKDYKNAIKTPKIYDYSERHMEYATSKMFADDKENENGYNRKVGSGGNFYYAESYLTNGTGAIDESEMPFENNENTIDISEIQNKDVTSQVYDTVAFSNYNSASTTEAKEEIMTQIKEHIKNYGSVFAMIHGNTSSGMGDTCYNNSTGAKYCSDSITHTVNHAVSIIGWDDNYSVDNFSSSSKPTSNGAWIVRNSWGEKQEYDLEDLKNQVFTTYNTQCEEQGFNSADEVTDEFLESLGYTIEDGKAYKPIGDNGLIYVSYEDANISKGLNGIVKSNDAVDYDNIYQYDMYFPAQQVTMNNPKIMLCNVFDKKTSGTEYLTEVSLYAPETYTCKVYVNPNGTSKTSSDMQAVALKAGETETVSAGYHTLEFKEPMKIEGSQFAVAVEIEGKNANSIKVALEAKVKLNGKELEAYNCVQTETEKCFYAAADDFDNCVWKDLGKISEENSSIQNSDSSIKAFTTNELYDGTLKNIEITTPPTKTSYFEGENFDEDGMVVKANYNSKTNQTITLDSSNYEITNGTNLKEGQTSVTISYNGKTVEQDITVEKNNVTDLKITTAPTTTTYKAGHDFDNTGMVVEASFKDGTTKIVTDYTIPDGTSLTEGQKEVTISYGDKIAKQAITVEANDLTEIKISNAPTKTKYVVGQNFDKTGMKIAAIYSDGLTKEISNYIIENGTNLTKDQNSVTIKYVDKSTEQPITVEEKTITELKVSQLPSKTQYYQNKEKLDLTGGKIEAKYNDDSNETLDMTSGLVTTEGFDNSKIGKDTIIIKYQGKEVTFDIDIIEEPKPENSNFDKATCNIDEYRVYTKGTDQGYAILGVIIDGIVSSNKNDNCEYYYYLSQNKDESNIENWIKITDASVSDGKLSFKINTNDVKNIDDFDENSKVYLYIKEIATRGDNQSTKISQAIELKTSDNLKTYINDVPAQDAIKNTTTSTVASDVVSTISGNTTKTSISDTTIAKTTIPNAGVKTFFIVIIVIAIVGLITFIKYRNLNKYVK